MARLLSFVLLLGFAPLAEATIVISEVLADPPSGAAGDANQDGQRDTYGDEFVELYNAGSAPVDISGWRLGDSTSSDNFFQFPANTIIEPGLVRRPLRRRHSIGIHRPVYTDDGRIGNGLTNSGEEIRLIDDTGAEVAVVSHDTWPSDQSSSAIHPTATNVVPHKTASTIKALFSPGPNAHHPEPNRNTAQTYTPYPLFISEVLADPPSVPCWRRQSQDGRRDTYEDEFIELYNAGSASPSISLAGWRLGRQHGSPELLPIPSPTRSLNPARTSSSSAAAPIGIHRPRLY